MNFQIIVERRMGIGIVVPLSNQRISIEGSVNVKVGISRSRRSNELWSSGVWIGWLNRAHVAHQSSSTRHTISSVGDKKGAVGLTLVRGLPYLACREGDNFHWQEVLWQRQTDIFNCSCSKRMA
jgi:hypothetical protein